MKKKWRNLLITGGLCFSFLGAGAGRCLAQEQGETVRSDASHVILVTETNGAEVTVTYYQKEESRSRRGNQCHLESDFYCPRTLWTWRDHRREKGR